MDSTKLKESFYRRGFNIFLCKKLSSMPELFEFISPEQKNKTLCFLASGGGYLWPFITNIKTKDPIDQYTIKQIQKIGSEELNGDIEILFPNNDHEHFVLPLQKISRLMGFSHPSPMGIDISNEFGLWFGIRGIFLTSTQLPEITAIPFISPCESCLEKACLDSRLLCPYKSEKRYSNEELAYYQYVLNTMLTKS